MSVKSRTALDFPPEVIEQFKTNGFVVIRDFFPAEVTKAVIDRVTAMGEQAVEQVQKAKKAGMSTAEYASKNPNELLVVPEANNSDQVCRFEYIFGSDPQLKELILSHVEPVFEGLTGKKYTPFKDKQNEKKAGGGGFPPHQDFAAYQHFGPRFEATAMMTIDPCTNENGCLRFPSNNWSTDKKIIADEHVDKWVEGKPLFNWYQGGARNGDIVDEVNNLLEWQIVETRPGDLVVFDAFVPHYSEPNTSNKNRRILLLTFNDVEEGHWYERYYEDKRTNYLDPKFHVSTPTTHQ